MIVFRKFSGRYTLELMSLSVFCPSELASLATALGFSQRSDLPCLPPSPQKVKQAWAQGTPEVVCAVDTVEQLWRLRPLALFAAAFGEPLRSGSFQAGLRTSGGFIASEWRTAQQGALLFVHNPTDSPLTGSVFPAFEERTLEAGETVIWAHDFPIGLSENYLGAYAGLVKSEAMLLTAHIRPDPHPGARVFVIGKPGDRAEVTLFNAGPGEAVEIVFGETPAVSSVGVSQVVAVPETLAPHLWLLPETTWLGSHWELTHAGALVAHPTLQETRITGDNEPRTAQLIFEGAPADSVWLNGVPVTSSELTLLPGENTLQVRGEPGPAFILPDGACFQVELTEWATQSSQ